MVPHLQPAGWVLGGAERRMRRETEAIQELSGFMASHRAELQMQHKNSQRTSTGSSFTEPRSFFTPVPAAAFIPTLENLKTGEELLNLTIFGSNFHFCKQN